MPDYAVSLIVALLALTGTIAGLWAAHRRWRSERRAPFLEQRQRVYRELWESAESLAVGLRGGELPPDQADQRVRDLNVLMLKAGPFIDEEDRLTTQRYLDAVRSFLDILSASGEAEAQAEVEQTRDIPLSVLDRVHDLRDAYEKALQARQRLLARLRLVLKEAP